MTKRIKHIRALFPFQRSALNPVVDAELRERVWSHMVYNRNHEARLSACLTLREGLN